VRRVGGLFERVASFENLARAFEAAARGKRRRADVREYAMDLERRLFETRAALLAGGYRFGPYRSFQVADSKPRLILAAPFGDRVVHHAIVRVLEPLLDPTFAHACYACRRGQGNHAAVRRLRDYVRGDPRAYALKCDVRRYFDSVDHGLLLGLLERHLSDRRLLDLIAALLAATPRGAGLAPGRGIPIGNLTSQLFANLYLTPLDRYAQGPLGLGRYLRYVDDIVAVDGDPGRLGAALAALGAFAAARLRLSFHPRKASVRPVRCGVDFLGFLVLPTHTRMRRAAVLRFRRRERAQRGAYWRGELSRERYWQSVQSWAAHARHADTGGLLAALGLTTIRPGRPEEGAGPVKQTGGAPAGGGDPRRQLEQWRERGRVLAELEQRALEPEHEHRRALLPEG
jgi:hypothetical protein